MKLSFGFACWRSDLAFRTEYMKSKCRTSQKSDPIDRSHLTASRMNWLRLLRRGLMMTSASLCKPSGPPASEKNSQAGVKAALNAPIKDCQLGAPEFGPKLPEKKRGEGKTSEVDRSSGVSWRCYRNRFDLRTC